MSTVPYRDGTALWRAVGDRARAAAKATGRPANELVRRFVYDRFLARVFADPSAPWVLKGGTAVLARVADARHSMDVDLLRSLGDIDEALTALRAAAALDLHDHFQFVVGSVRAGGGAAQQPDIAGYRVQIDAYCGPRRCEAFKVDLVTGSVMTMGPEIVRSSTPVEVPGLQPPTLRTYPVVDHIADTGAPLSVAIAAERLHRGLPAVHSFTVPPLWAGQYPPIAATTPHCEGLRDTASAVRFVAGFLEPAMTGAVDAHVWSPIDRGWQPR